MKVRLTVLALVLFLFPLLACAQISVKVPNLAGLTVPQAHIAVENRTPFTADVVAACKNLGEIRPSASLYDREPVPFEGADLPIMARVFSASGEFLGIAHKKLQVYSGRESIWRIRLRDVEFVDGQRRNSREGERVYPDPRVAESRAVDFPRPFVEGTTWIQVGNSTHFEGILKMDGRPVKHLDSGDIQCLKFESLVRTGRSRRFTVSMEFVDDGRVVGYSRDYTVAFARQRPTAYQFVFGPRDVRNY